MVHALGFSNTPFNPFRAGRLCRGRERWIEPWEPDEGQEEEVHRLVISGAAFSDLSASDALRGIPHSKVDAAAIITALFPRKKMLAFMEDGHPADIPEQAEGVELYEGFRAGGRVQSAMVRWWVEISGVKATRALLGQELRGFAVLDGDTEESSALFDDLFLLVGMATLDSPPARFQPAALPELVKRVKALVLVHRDKHGPALGIYSAEPIDVGEKLQGLCDRADSLLVPFAIPPMLARWDRALSELRDDWDREEPFPVPVPEGGYNWESRGRRRRGRRRDKKDDKKHGAEGEDEELLDEVEDDDASEEVEKPRKRKSSKGKKARAAEEDVHDDDADDDDADDGDEETSEPDPLDALLVVEDD